jgi:hypothetical protein
MITPPLDSLYQVKTLKGTLDKAKLFGLTDENAKQTRLSGLHSQIQDFETRIQTALKLWWSEANPVGQEILEDKVLTPHFKVLNDFKTELENWSKPIKQYNAQQTPLDWSKASLYPCTDLLGNPSKKMGKEWVYKAPHRDDKNPSFSVNVDKNIWHDWGSGEGGNVFDLYILLNNGTKVEACKALLNLS